MNRRIYTKKFESIGLECQLLFDPEVFKANPTSALQIKWEKPPTDEQRHEVMEEYMKFKEVAFQDCADAIGEDAGEDILMLDVTQFNGKIQVVCFGRGRPPLKLPIMEKDFFFQHKDYLMEQFKKSVQEFNDARKKME